MRFLHTSDWQLGMTRAFLGEEAVARFAQARIGAITTLGKHAADNGAGFIIVAGDVFESNQVSRVVLARTIDALEALPVPVFLLPGNHDPLDGASIFATKEFESTSEHVIVIRDMTPIPVPGLQGVEVVGAPWRSKRPGSDLCRELAESLQPAQGVMRIAVAHGQVTSLAPDTSRAEVIDEGALDAALAAGKFHYVGLGDRHSVHPVGSSGRSWYSGAPVATAFDETDPNKALLVDLADNECRVSPLDVGNWHFIAAQRALDGPGDLAEFSDWLDSLPDKECTAVKVGLEGSINLATAGALDELLAEHAPRFASLRIRERTTRLAVLPDALDQDSVALAGYARAAWNELLEQANDGDGEASDALRLLYRLSRAGGA